MCTGGNKNETKKSICFLSDILIIGGMENVLVEALKILHKKYDITVISLHQTPEKAILDKIPPDVTIIDRQISKRSLWYKLSQIPYIGGLCLNRAIGQKRYDYIISLKRGLIYAVFSNRAKKKIYWCHNDYDTEYLHKKEKLTVKEKLNKRISKTLYKKNNAVWCVNSDIANGLSEIFSLNNFCALPNPIDCNGILEKAEASCDVKFDESKLNILLLGRVVKEKGFARVAKILTEELFEKYPNVHLYILGGGHSSMANKYAEKHNVSDKITVLGAKSNPYPYLKQAQLLVCPSQYESFGLVMLEAMLLKVPVIATDTSGGKYVTQNGRLAKLVKNDNSSLKQGIEEFIANPNAYGYSLDIAQQWAMEHDVKFFAERIFELLEEC